MPLTPVLTTGKSTVSYDAAFLTEQEAQDAFAYLETVPVRSETVVMWGKRITVRRRTYAFATRDKYSRYRYAGTENRAKAPMPPVIDAMRKKIKRVYGIKTNYVFLNEYADATVGIGAHADDEPGIEPDSDIVGVSLGRSAPFVFHPKRGGRRVAQQVLEHGSAAVMSGKCQSEFKHSIPATSKPRFPPVDVGLDEPTNKRYSLTFRLNKATRLQHEQARDGKRNK